MQTSARITRSGWAGTTLLVAVVYEVGLMGSGRLLQFGPLTLRMWLFLAALAFAAVTSYAKPKTSLASLMLCAALGTLLSTSALIGLSLRADLALVGEDIKPLSYFFLILFYETVIRTYAHVHLVATALKRIAFILCFMYAVVIGLIVTKILSFIVVASAVSSMSDDFIFRNDSGMFVYKGALYIGVGLVFFVFSKGRWAIAATVLCTLATLATGTRGFLLALLGVALVYNLFSRGPLWRKTVIVGIAALAGLVGWAVVGDSKMHAGSNAYRLITAQQVLSHLGVLSLLLGHGFGIGVPVRPIHMEVTYLEIFHKQGLLGLAWWLAVSCLLIDRYQRSLRRGNHLLATPFFLAVIFVVIESWSNPWIANPIGMAVLLLALACLRVLAEPDVLSQPESMIAVHPSECCEASARASG